MAHDVLSPLMRCLAVFALIAALGFTTALCGYFWTRRHFAKESTMPWGEFVLLLLWAAETCRYNYPRTAGTVAAIGGPLTLLGKALYIAPAFKKERRATLSGYEWLPIFLSICGNVFWGIFLLFLFVLAIQFLPTHNNLRWWNELGVILYVGSTAFLGYRTYGNLCEGEFESEPE